MTMNKAEKLMHLLKYTDEFIKSMGASYIDGSTEKLSVCNSLSAYSIPELNFFLETIDEKVATLEKRKEQKLIGAERYNMLMGTYQVVVLSIISFVKAREDIGWRLSKNWKIYKKENIL